jgi:hypothetical protein
VNTRIRRKVLGVGAAWEDLDGKQIVSNEIKIQIEDEIIEAKE